MFDTYQCSYHIENKWIKSKGRSQVNTKEVVAEVGDVWLDLAGSRNDEKGLDLGPIFASAANMIQSWT